MIVPSYSLAGIIDNYISGDSAQSMRNVAEGRQGDTLSFVGFCDSNAVVCDVEQVPWEAGSSWEDILAFAKSRASSGSMLVLISVIPEEELKAGELHLKLSEMLKDEGIGLWLVNSDVTKIKALSDPVVVSSNVEDVEVDLENGVESFFADGGPLARVLEGYEARRGQIDMAAAVAETIEKGDILSVEAGTGTGKSLAYLVPTVMSMKRRGCKAVISTNTINLQEQLLTKDIPLLASAMGEEIKAVLVKGRSNYVCMRKLERLILEYSALAGSSLPKGFEKFIKWADSTSTGDRSEMKFEVEQDVWDEVACDSDMCLHSRCVYYPRCYFHRARREMEPADVLVVNHHLLCSDISVKMDSDSPKDHAVLPAYSIAVIDEAHNLPGAAQSYFGVASSSRKMARILNLLYRKEGHRVGTEGGQDYDFGVLIRLREKITSYRWSVPEKKTKLLELLDLNLIPGVMRAREIGDSMYDSVYSFVEGGNAGSLSKIMRITDEVRNDIAFKTSVIPQFERFCSALSDVTSLEESVLMSLTDDEDDEDFSDFEIEKAELNACISRCRELKDSTEFVIRGGDDEFVYWAETGKKRGAVALVATPISVGESLAQNLIEPLDACVMTSATMSVGRNFSFIRRELGLDELERERLKEMIVPSPFDYRSQVLLGITTDTPDPNEKGYFEKVTSAIEKVVMASEGRAFVLFTSHKLLRDCADALFDKFEALNVRFLRQGQMPRHLLLKEFKSGEGAAVLFGTDSFWEGVDVPGEALSCVVLVRLPFGVPTDPVIQAKVEKIKDLGGNPFNDFYVPSAVLKFKQGFGRLIRTTEDTGVVVVLDSRICKKSYGRAFIEALPECEMFTGGADEVAKAVKGWFNA